MTTIPLNKLTPAKANVRKTGAGDGIGELAASIAAHGLLTSLVVKKAARGKHAVIAGQRRYQALMLLAGADKIPADLPVPCLVAEDGADATEIGLAENVVRLAMHPADQFEAFRALMDKGSSAADIATRFGVSEATVTKRMKLGRVSPVILDAYRAGDLSLEQVQAFTVSDDHEAQERVWSEGGHRCNPTAIRRALTEGETPATDKRARFVGLEAYEAAGGTVRRDLFDDRNAGYILDPDLLDRLVRDKLEALLEPLRAEGWKWAEAHPDFTHEDQALFRRRHPEEVPLPEAEAQELERLTAEYDALSDAQAEDGEDDEAAERMQAIEQRADELNALGHAWTDEARAMCGVILYLSHDGSVEEERGLIRPEDARDHTGMDEEADTGEADLPAPSLTAKLVMDLTAQKTAAIRATLARQPDVALASVTHALARRAFYTYGGDTCLDIVVRQRSLTTPIAEPDDCAGLTAFDAVRAEWMDRLPADADDLFAWCLRQTQDTLLGLLAVSAAHAVDAVRDKGTREEGHRLLHADALARALTLDMQAWFTPGAANYFGRVNRTFILEALSEAGRPLRTRSWAKLKKSELAALAEREVQGTGWLPQPLRMQADLVQPDASRADTPVALAA